MVLELNLVQHLSAPQFIARRVTGCSLKAFSVYGLDVAIGLQAICTPLHAKSTLFVACKRGTCIGFPMAIDPYIPSLKLTCNMCGLLIITSPHGSPKASTSAVSSLDNISLV